MPGPVAQSDARLTGIQEVAGLILQSGTIGHKIISVTILSLPLIQVRQLSVIGVRMVKRLGLSLSRKSVAKSTDCFDMIIVVDWDVKQ